MIPVHVGEVDELRARDSCGVHVDPEFTLKYTYPADVVTARAEPSRLPDNPEKLMEERLKQEVQVQVPLKKTPQ